MSVKLADAMALVLADALADQIDAGAGSGTLKIYDGSQPADPDAAIGDNLLATITFASTAFGTATIVSSPEDAAEVTMATGVTDETNAASGTAAWFIIEESDGDNILTGTVTASGGGGDLELSTTTIPSGVTVSLTSGKLRVARNET